MDLLEQLAGEQVPTGLGGHRRSGPRCIDVHIRRLRAKLGDDLPVVRTSTEWDTAWTVAVRSPSPGWPAPTTRSGVTSATVG